MKLGSAIIAFYRLACLAVGLVFLLTSLPLASAEPVNALSGIGAQLDKKGNDIVIKGLTPGGPAEKAGIPVGTRIVSVDGKNITGMALEDTVKLIRGAAGTVASLAVIQNPGVTRTYSLVRMEMKAVTLDTVVGTYVPADDPGATVVIERVAGNEFRVSSAKQHWSGIGLAGLMMPPDFYYIKGVYVMDDHPDVIDGLRKTGVFFRIEFDFNNHLRLLTRYNFEDAPNGPPLSKLMTHNLQKQ